MTDHFNEGRHVGHQVARKGLDPSDIIDQPSWVTALVEGPEAIEEWWDGYHEAREEPPEPEGL